MSFILDDLTCIRGQDKPQDVQGLYGYRTTDSRTTVGTLNYFIQGYTKVRSTDTTTTNSTSTQNCSNKFYSGDVIYVQQVDSNNNVLDSYKAMVTVIVKGASPMIETTIYDDGDIVAFGTLADVSAASTTTITFGTTVDLESVDVYLGGTIATANDAIDVKIGATSVSGAALTVLYSGSAMGDHYSSAPYALRTGSAFIISSDGASTVTQPLYIVLKGKKTSSELVRVDVTIPDVSSAETAYGYCPVAGKIVAIKSVLQSAISVADATVTCKIGSTSITSGTLTITAAGSAAGDIDSATPSAANITTEGALLVAASDGGSTTAATLVVSFFILR